MSTTQTVTFLADLTADELWDLAKAIREAHLDSIGIGEDYSAFTWKRSHSIKGRYALLINGVQIGWAIKEGRKWVAVAARKSGPGIVLWDDLDSRNEAASEIARYQHGQVA